MQSYIPHLNPGDQLNVLLFVCFCVCVCVCTGVGVTVSQTEYPATVTAHKCDTRGLQPILDHVLQPRDTYNYKRKHIITGIISWEWECESLQKSCCHVVLHGILGDLRLFHAVTTSCLKGEPNWRSTTGPINRSVNFKKEDSDSEQFLSFLYISDVINWASMCGKSVKYVRSPTVLAPHW